MEAFREFVEKLKETYRSVAAVCPILQIIVVTVILVCALATTVSICSTAEYPDGTSTSSWTDQKRESLFPMRFDSMTDCYLEVSWKSFIVSFLGIPLLMFCCHLCYRCCTCQLDDERRYFYSNNADYNYEQI